MAEAGDTTAPRGGVQRRQQRREVAIAGGERGAVRGGEEGDQSRLFRAPRRGMRVYVLLVPILLVPIILSRASDRIRGIERGGVQAPQRAKERDEFEFDRRRRAAVRAGFARVPALAARRGVAFVRKPLAALVGVAVVGVVGVCVGSLVGVVGGGGGGGVAVVVIRRGGKDGRGRRSERIRRGGRRRRGGGIEKRASRRGVRRRAFERVPRERLEVFRVGAIRRRVLARGERDG